MTGGEVFHECFVLWPAYQGLHGHCSLRSAMDTDPHDFVGLVAGMGADRAVSFLHAHCRGDDLAEAAVLLDELLGMARAGRRPRCAVELGLTSEMFFGGAGV